MFSVFALMFRQLFVSFVVEKSKNKVYIQLLIVLKFFRYPSSEFLKWQY
jgi:hypothetical protein